jgi:hypothetical protein
VKNRAGERIEDPAAAVTLVIHHRFTMTPVYSQAISRPAIRADQTLRMQPGNQRLITRIFVHQIRNWKIHGQLLLEQPTLKSLSFVARTDKTPAKEHEPNVERLPHLRAMV